MFGLVGILANTGVNFTTERYEPRLHSDSPQVRFIPSGRFPIRFITFITIADVVSYQQNTTTRSLHLRQSWGEHDRIRKIGKRLIYRQQSAGDETIAWKPEIRNILFSNSLRKDAEEPDYGEVKPSPFSFSSDQGLLEQVREGVRPLTDDGDFQLESISYCDSYQDGGTIRLTSPHMDINFLHNLRVLTEVPVYFRIRLVKEPFKAKTLFAARHIPITFHSCELSREGSERARAGAHNGENFIAILLEETGFIEELHRLSREIRANLPALYNAFAPENLDETLRLYAIKCRENRQSSGRSRSAAGQRRGELIGAERSEAGTRRGKIERIFEAMRPIDRLYNHKTIYYDVIRDRFDIDALQSDDAGCGIYFRSGADDELYVYFFGNLPKEPVNGRGETGNRVESFFSAANVFELLDIDDSTVMEWQTKNLHAFCELIADNAAALFRAFSMENKAKTFAALMTMKGNDSETIRKIRDRNRGIIE